MKTVDYRTVLQAFHSLQPGTPQSPLADAQLVCPSEDWLRDRFWPWAKGYLRSYTPEKYDCENFCEKMRVLFTECLAETTTVGNVGSAFFTCFVKLSGDLNGVRDGNHATNLVLVDDGSEDGKLVFFEPQNGRITDAKTAVHSGVALPYFIQL
jgi:hypothetical protein